MGWRGRVWPWRYCLTPRPDLPEPGLCSLCPLGDYNAWRIDVTKYLWRDCQESETIRAITVSVLTFLAFMYPKYKTPIPQMRAFAGLVAQFLIWQLWGTPSCSRQLYQCPFSILFGYQSKMPQVYVYLEQKCLRDIFSTWWELQSPLDNSLL